MENNGIKYSGAPYNFVPVNYHVQKNYAEKKQLPKHNKMSEDLLSGEIEYSIKAETSVFVGGHNGEEFYRDVYGRYAIPGSTLKGLIRTNMQILGFGSVVRDIEDYNLMYRKVADKGTKSCRYYRDNILGVKTVSLPNGGQITVPTNVEAGYIYCRDGKYYIKKSAAEPFNRDSFGKLNYYSISERVILEDIKNGGGKFSLDTSVFQNRRFSKSERIIKGKTQIEWKGDLNYDYYPYWKKVYYVPYNKSVSAIIEASKTKTVPKGYETGYLLSTGMMSKKKAVYIISAMMDTDEAIPIPDKDVLAYKYDYEQKKNQLHGTKLKKENLKERARQFFELPKDGEAPRPVFFVYNEGRVFFGYTPYLRIFYSHSVLDGLNETQTDIISSETGRFHDVLLDYPSTLLGFSDIIQKDKDSKKTTESYKTRVSFEDAIIDSEGQVKVDNVVLSSPKMSSYMDYVVQKGKVESTYNEDGFELRGIKQFWFRDCEYQTEITSETQKTILKTLRKGTEFKGRIHYKNLRKEELGLLLWCLDLGADMQQNIGKAKPYGYGRVHVNITGLKKYNLAKMYDLNSLSLDVYEDLTGNIHEYVAAYKEEIHDKLGLRETELENTQSIKDFLIMKNAKKKPAADNIRYMSVGDGDYQNREYALPTPEQVIKGEKGAKIENVSSKGKSGGNFNNGRPSRNDGGYSKNNGAYSKNNGGYSKNNSGYSNSNEVAMEYRDEDHAKNTGKEVEAEFVSFNSKKKEVTVSVNGKQIVLVVDGFKTLQYNNMKPNTKVKLRQDGKKFELV